MLAGLQTQPDVLEVVRVRGADVDEVDGGVGHELRIRTVRLFKTEALGEGAGAVEVSGADGVGDDLGAEGVEGSGHLLADVAGSKEGDA